MLVVMYNNRAYYNDWEHQVRMARQRGTPEERANIGMEIAQARRPISPALAQLDGLVRRGPDREPERRRAQHCSAPFAR